MTDLTCIEFVELVTGYLDEALDAETWRRFAEHLPTCEGCRRYLNQHRLVIRTLGDLPAASLAP
jgi:anti-sigma factor RsiW